MKTLLTIICFLTAMFLFFIFLPYQLSAEEPPQLVEIVGRVINKTAEGQGVDGLEVRIYQYEKGGVSELGRTRTKSDGSFIFSRLKPEPSLIYYVMTKYKGIFYFSKAFHIKEKRIFTVELPIYETTNKGQDISIKVHHIIFEPSGQWLWIREFMVYENRGNMTFVGSRKMTEDGKSEVVKISLPESALGIQFDQSVASYMIKTEDGFVSTLKLKPGSTNIAFSYRMNLSNKNLLFHKKINWQTENMELIFPAKGVRVTADKLKFKGPVMDPSKRFLHLSGKDLKKGSDLVVKLELESRREFLKWILGLIGIFVFIVGFVLSILRIKKMSP